MRVKVHPHKTMVNAGVEACVSVTADRKHGRAYYMGTVALADASFRVHTSGVKRAQVEQVRNVHAWATGDLLFEFSEQQALYVADMVQVTYHYNVGRFLTIDPDPAKVVDVTDGQFNAAVFIGRDFYVSKEW